MSSATAAASAFLDWFVSQGGLVSPSVEIVDYGHGMGRGAQATSSIQADEQLFAIPRDLVLSTSTASLPAKLSTEQWSALANQGWCGLILCMQYEASLGPQSRWHPYFQLLPTHFDSLMHWSDSELQELQGSMVLDKIGKEAAEADYRETVLPLLRQRPDLFGSDVTDYSSPFSLQKYHTMGSLILSRSFNVDPSGGDVNAEASGQGEEAQGGASAQDSQGDVSMEGPSNASQQNEHADEDEDDDDDDEEEEEESGAAHVAMVPFADILNAKSGANNAELSYEAEYLVMKSVKPISKGEQIFNTYASPPNSDLLRRYGHVDENSEFDVVEIDAKLVAATVSAAVVGASDQQERKIEWLLDSGLDDTYSITHDELLPEELVSCLLLFAASSKAFEKMVERGAWPEPQEDKMTLKVLKRVLKARMDLYPTTLEADRSELKTAGGRKRMALVVRIGEKELLEKAMQQVDSVLSASKRKAPAGDGRSSLAKRSR